MAASTNGVNGDYADKSLRFFPIIHKISWNCVHEVGQINEWLHSASSKWHGLAMMQRILTHCKSDVIAKYGTSWIEISAQVAVKGYDDDHVRYMASDNFTKLLSYVSQLPAMARSISSSIPTRVEEILHSTLVDPVPSLICIDAIMKYFPGPCGPFKGKISKYLSQHIVSSQRDVQSVAVRCWSKIPILGGGGSGKKLHIAQWERQFLDVLFSLEYVSLCLYEPNPNEEAIDPSVESLSLYFVPLPVAEPDLSFTLMIRFLSLCECLVELLSLDVTLPTSLPAGQLFNLLMKCFDLSPKLLGWTAEMQHRTEYLANAHTACLKVLRKFIAVCPHHLCRHALNMNGMFLTILTTWKDRNPSAGSEKLFSRLRNEIYATIICWVQCCGAKSKFLCGQEKLVTPLLNSILDDVIPIAENIVLDKNKQSEDASVNLRTKCKRKKLTATDISFSRLFDDCANADLCSSALKVLRVTVYTMASRLDTMVHKSLQDTVTTLLSKLMGGGQLVPYTKCEKSRKELYHLSLSLIMAPSTKFPVPLHFAVRIFCHAASLDQSTEVRSFCREASVTVSNLLRPRAPVMYSAPISATNHWAKNSENVDRATFDVATPTQREEANGDGRISFASTEQRPDYSSCPDTSRSSVSDFPANESLEVERSENEIVADQTSKPDPVDPSQPGLQRDEKSIERMDCDLSAEEARDAMGVVKVRENDGLSSQPLACSEENTKNPWCDTPAETNTRHSGDDLSVGDDVAAMLSDFVDAAPDSEQDCL